MRSSPKSSARAASRWPSWSASVPSLRIVRLVLRHTMTATDFCVNSDDCDLRDCGNERVDIPHCSIPRAPEAAGHRVHGRGVRWRRDSSRACCHSLQLGESNVCVQVCLRRHPDQCLPHLHAENTVSATPQHTVPDTRMMHDVRVQQQQQCAHNNSAILFNSFSDRPTHGGRRACGPPVYRE